MARLFNHVLLQQTQPEDSQGAITITNMYTTWSVISFFLLFCGHYYCHSLSLALARSRTKRKPGGVEVAGGGVTPSYSRSKGYGF